MAESDDYLPQGSVNKVAISIAIANGVRIYRKSEAYIWQMRAAQVIDDVKRALQSGEDLDDQRLREKVAIKINHSKHCTEEYWLSRANEIIEEVAALLAQPVEGESTDERYSS